MKLPTFDSMIACAAATGIPMPVLRAAKRAGCPAFDSHSRVSLAALLPWLFRPDAADGEKGVDWHQRFKRAQALGAEQQLAKERGQLIDAPLLGEQLQRAASACKSVIARAVDQRAIEFAAASGDIVDARQLLRAVLDEHFEAIRTTVRPFLKVVDDNTAAAVREITNPSTNETKPETTPPDEAGSSD